MTNRERLGVHLSSPTCASCHRLVDPIGFGFEQFDAIGRYREKQVALVYPPVDTTFFHPDGTPPEGFALIVSALVPYKRIDVAISACAQAGVAAASATDAAARASRTRRG